MADKDDKEWLLLKWGTLKGWILKNEDSREILKRYAELGHALGAIQQEDTPEQKELICQLIDIIDGDIENDWTGKMMTKDQAKEYIRTYGGA